jgi:7-carboxy-7-deazaguanine synthase
MATLVVAEVFDSLQGEGFWTGIPMTFVRLSGCNASNLGLKCIEWCDTPASWDLDSGERIEVGQLIRQVTLPRLCITGGEPLLQIDGVTALALLAHDHGIKVHLETNGTIDPLPLMRNGRIIKNAGGVKGTPVGRNDQIAPAQGSDLLDWAVVSPKPPQYHVAPEWVGRLQELKLVADPYLDSATAERLACQHPQAFICVQPEYGTGLRSGAGRESLSRAMRLVIDHPEWRLSVQMHKLLGIR